MNDGVAYFKKILLLQVIISVLLLTSCQQQTPPASPDEENSSGGVAEWITPADAVDLDGMNLFWQQDNLQFVADDNAILSLYVKAEKNENGDFSFDDGQDWLLLMETSLGVYPLFPRQRVQLGKVSCAAFNDDAGGDTVSHVLVTVTQTAGYKIYDCIYDKEKKAFIIMPVYDVQGINFMGGSF